jgi:prevent-host-death family protein
VSDSGAARLDAVKTKVRDDLSFRVKVVMMVHMKKASLVHAKAHLSELVDAAEHRGQRVLILRHGKPAAAIVPVAVAERRTKKHRPMTAAEAESLLQEVEKSGRPSSMSITEALGRDRLD